MKYPFILFVLLAFTTVSCSSDVDKDAKNAVELMKKSMTSALDKDMELADKYYRQYVEIEERYKNTDKEKSFNEVYWRLLNENPL